MWRLLASVVLGVLALGGTPRRANAAPPAITSAEARPFILSHAAISKAIDPSRNIHRVADDVHQVDSRSIAGIREFDERVTSYVEDPGGPTILLPEGVFSFDASRPVDGVIGKFSASSDVSQHTTVAATADTVSVRSKGDLVCRQTRIPNNALMAAFPTGNASVGVSIQIARPCRYSLTATISADPDDHPFGFGRATLTISGPDAVQIPDGVRAIDVQIDGPAPGSPRTDSLHLSGVFQPGFVELTMGANLDRSGHEGRASWNATLTLSPDGPSDDIRWTTPSGGGFGNTANWIPPQVPLKDATHTDNAIFDLNRTYTVDFAATKIAALRTSDRLLVERGHVTFENANYKVDGLSLAEPSLSVDVGTLTLASGNLTTNSATIGDLHSVGAEVEVTGQASRWDCLGELRVGGSTGGSGAAGKLTIAGGASVASAESLVGAAGQDGNVVVDGTGSQWTTGNMHVGFSSPARLDIKDGAVVTSDTVLVGGGFSTAQFASGGFAGANAFVGGVAADGTPAQWDTTQLTLGQGAFVAALDGGRMSATDLGVFGGGFLLVQRVERSKASLVACNSLRVGTDGLVVVQEGGDLEVAVGDLSVGASANRGRGRLTVGGADPATGRVSTLHVDGELSVGLGAGNVGSFEVSGGGTVTSGKGFVGTETGEVGGVLLDGATSSWTVTGDLLVGGAIASAPGSAGVIVMNGALLRATGDICVEETGTIQGAGTLAVGGSVVANGFVSPGIVRQAAPVAPPKRPVRPRAKPAAPLGGKLTIQGDLVVGATGVITADAAGTQADQLVVTGNATLDGTLVLQFKNGFAPKTGDQFEVLHVDGAVTGNFASVDLRGLAPGAQFDVTTTAGAFKATATNDSVALPTVSVKASPKKLLEKKPKKKGILTFTRKGDVSAPLTVAYAVGGTAENGVDCVQLLGSVTFPARKRSVKVAVTVANDRVREAAETLDVSVVSGADYTASVASTARFAIVDND